MHSLRWKVLGDRYNLDRGYIPATPLTGTSQAPLYIFDIGSYTLAQTISFRLVHFVRTVSFVYFFFLCSRLLRILLNIAHLFSRFQGLTIVLMLDN